MRYKNYVLAVLGIALTGSLLMSGCGSRAEKSAEESVISVNSEKEDKSEAEKTETEKEQALPEKEAAEKEAEDSGEKAKEEKEQEETGVEELTATVEKEEEKVPEVIPENDEFVRVKDYIPDMLVDLKYATSDNFTGAVIYDFTEAYLRYGTVMKLSEVQDALKEQGMELKIWDAFRPFSAQERLWEVYPDPVYVANPANGVGGHCIGGTIDITLVYSDGTDVLMPTGFDDFSVKANRDYSDCTDEERENALILQNVMYEHGFTGYDGEWWDFSDVEQYSTYLDFVPPEE